GGGGLEGGGEQEDVALEGRQPEEADEHVEGERPRRMIAGRVVAVGCRLRRTLRGVRLDEPAHAVECCDERLLVRVRPVTRLVHDRAIRGVANLPACMPRALSAPSTCTRTR